MCGICGQVTLSSTEPVDARVVASMATALRHRGPDDDGFYCDRQVVLGHRRLSIIDLSTGAQPLSNEDGTVWVVYNGEIYNFKQLRKDLLSKGHVFRTYSDTEVIVHLYEDYGEACVSKLQGMFAFALWDARYQILLIARDRVGIKPLYYVVNAQRLSFASEIKALIADPDLKLEVDAQAVDKLLTYFYIPGRETLLRNVYKLEPGHYLTVRNSRVQIKKYWDLRFAAPLWKGNVDAAVAELTDLIQETVRDHMISDVPVGVLLSGGLDSTSLLSFAVQDRTEDVKTFTIGFAGAGVVDERPYARLAARVFGNKHYETTITAREFLDFLPKYVWHMEEPVCEPPAVSLYYVSKTAREHVKVLLSGEGGDEAFAGYRNYRNIVWMERARAAAGACAKPTARLLRWAACAAAHRGLANYSRLMNLSLGQYYYSRTSGPFSGFNRIKPALYTNEFCGRVSAARSHEFVRSLFAEVQNQPALNQMLYVDTKTWLPDDLLVKADKMTMANSVELRVPLLDHKILEFAARLPADYKIKGFTTKYILRRAFRGRVPRAILSRKKVGFATPFAGWLLNELREFTHDVLTDRRTLERGYFNKQQFAAFLNRAAGDEGYANEVFSLITLELWHRAFIDGRH